MALRFLSSETIDGNLSFNGSTLISSNTADGSDNAQIVISGAGAQGDTRGASIHLSGNEHGNGGLLQIRAGDGSVGGIRLYTGGSERMRISEPLITFPTITELRGDIASAKFAVGNMGDASSQMMVSSRGFLTLNVSNTGSALDALERLRITATGAISVGSTGTNYGTSGQVLTSGGNSNPTWTTPTTGDVTGSGAANYVTYWTGAKTVSGTANFQYDGSINLGLGSAPTAFGTGVPTLLFKGTNSTNGRAGAIWFKENDGTDTAALYVTDGGDGYGTTLCAYQGDINFATSSLADRKMTITSAGKVGIGTTSPAQTLEVVNSGFAYVRTRSTAGSYTGFDIGQHTGGGIFLNNRDNTAITLMTNNTTHVTFNADRTTTFEANIHVDVINNAANSANIIYRSGTSTLVGGGSTANKLYVLDSGNVGIGTTSPTGKITSEAPGNHLHLRATTAAAGKYWNLDVTANNQLFIITDGGLGMNITNTGNVGIGTTAPIQKLHVEGTTATIHVQSTTANQNASIWFNSNVGGTQANRWEIGTNISAASDLEFFDRLNSVSRMVIQNDGKVGIGTISPSSKLFVKHDVASEWAGTFQNLSSNAYGLSIDCSTASSATFVLAAYSPSGTGMFLNGTGNLGVGTTSPSAALDISGASTNQIGAAIINETSTTAYTATSFNNRPTYTLYGINTANTYVGTRLSHAGNTEFFQGIVKGANNGEMEYVWQGYNGTAYQQFGQIDCYGTGAGTLTMAGDVVAYSDKKLKKNIKTLDGSKVYNMRGVSFTRKDTGKEGSGVIAQEIQEIAPELIKTSNDGTLGVAYGNLSGYLIEAIKEQQKQIDRLEEQIKKMSSKN